MAVPGGVKTWSFGEGAGLGGEKTQSFDYTSKIDHCGSVGGGRGVYGRADGDFPIAMQASVKIQSWTKDGQLLNAAQLGPSRFMIISIMEV